MRSSGILLPLFSLPSPYGIGTMGKAAYDFADFLAAAGQKYWQLLPLGPTGYGDSPYQSFSSYAGNPYLIDPDMLAEDDLLTAEELADFSAESADSRLVDYGKLWDMRFALLRKAAARGLNRDGELFERFRSENPWLDTYSLFMALKQHFDRKPWTLWPEELRLRTEKTQMLLAHWKRKLQTDVDFYGYIQFLFYVQWEKLKTYIHEKGLKIIGDLPIYVPLDSADVWSEPQFFQLDEKNRPVEVAGVPPDYFSKDGQLWGNPLYDWDAMERDGFGWWIRRIDGAGRLYDLIRIDHFRGIDSYWAIPAGAENAKKGQWRKGPGMKLVGVLNGWFPQLQFIAEDLGEPSDSVTQLLKDSGWPGMKVLEFAFDPKGNSPYLPCRHIENCLVYSGTHDNVPLARWEKTLTGAERRFDRKYLRPAYGESLQEAVLRAGMGSPARLFIAPMQDWLGLGEEATLNRPGTSQGNWRWRLLPGEASLELASRIFEETKLYGRCDEPEKA